MARPHILFVQAQAVPWSTSGFADFGVQVDVKVLSRDGDTGAVSEIMRLPPGLALPGPMHFPCAVEFYVLDGAFSVGARSYAKDCYAYLPAGYVWAGLASARGAVLLAMFDAAPRPTRGAAPTGLYDPRKLVEYRNAYEMDWKTGIEGSVTGKPLSPTIFTKKLRVDPDTQEQSFLYAALPHHPPPKVMPGKFTHPMIEEIYVLSGEYVFGDAGKMGPGAYCWWRENEWHGPAGSETGYNLFIRVHGGPLVNRFSPEPSPFSYTPTHAPALPPDLARHNQSFPFVDPW
ncbi:MAG: hypothetical protein SFV21_21615 [Rhodospirillaceae bacterium]|nr:hypothetical protein [Rhodospirillaceae bacterium]